MAQRAGAVHGAFPETEDLKADPESFHTERDIF